MVKAMLFLFMGLFVATGVMLDYSLAAKLRGGDGYSGGDYVRDRIALLRDVAGAAPLGPPSELAAVPASRRDAGGNPADRAFPVNMIAGTFAAMGAVTRAKAPGPAAQIVPGAEILVTESGGGLAVDPKAVEAQYEAVAAALNEGAVTGGAAGAASEEQGADGLKRPVGRLTDRGCATKAGTKFCAVGTP